MKEPPGGFVLEQQRILAAPPERIFTLMTDPTELAKWWGPQAFTTPEIDLDLRVGGRYRYTMQPPDGEAFHLSGVFLEIDRPDRLAYSFRWDEPDPDDRETVVVLSLAAVGDATQVSLSQGEFATEERLALHRNGWADSLDKLEELIRTSGS
jgi:uncharacterized protein YndB with AHSA1/START domain